MPASASSYAATRARRSSSQASRCRSFTRSTAAWSVSSRLLVPSTTLSYLSVPPPWFARRRTRSMKAASPDVTMPASPYAPRFLPG